jgi:serine/threonine protein kinase
MEYRLLKMISHPSIISVKEVFVDEQKGRATMIMEHFTGTELGRLIARQRPLRGSFLFISLPTEK